MNPLAKRLSLFVVPPVAALYIRLLRHSMRISFQGREVLERAQKESGSYILAFWHSRFLLMPYVYPGKKMTVLSSWHRDSEMLVRTLRTFGYQFARGSTTRGGSAGLRALVRALRNGSDSGITCDGPRGPRRRVQAGIITAARLSGRPIIPVAFSAAGARRLKSWDRLMVPRAFSRGVFRYGDLFEVPKGADRAERERLRRKLEEILDRLTDEVDLELGMSLEELRPPE